MLRFSPYKKYSDSPYRLFYSWCRIKLFMMLLLILVCIACLPTRITANVPVASEVLRIDNTSGLSSQKVYSFFEDKYGAIWIGTKAGIDRYNGRTLKNYLLDNGTYYGDKAGRIIRLLETDSTLYGYDSSGNIYRYSPERDDFELRTQLAKEFNTEITLHKFIRYDGKELFATKSGLYLSSEGERPRPLLSGINTIDIVGHKGMIIAGTSSGLKILNEDMTVNDIPQFKDTYIQSLLIDTVRNSLYVGTFNKGLFEIDLKSREVSETAPGNKLLQKPIRALMKFSDNMLAIGVDGSGVLLLNQENNSIESLVNTELSPDFSFTGNGIYALYKDSHENLWIGTYTGGVTMISFAASPIKLITQNKNDLNSLANNNVNAIIENIDGNIWYATDRGISIYSPDKNKWTNIIKESVVVTLCRNSNGEVYAGCYGDGIYVLTPDGMIKNHWVKGREHISSNYIFSIEIDSDNNLWIGSPHGLLTKINDSGNLLHIYDIDNVISLVRINDTEIGAATVNGFYIINTKNGNYNWYASSQEQIGHDLSAYIIQICLNDDNTVWLATEGGGLNLYDITSRSIIRELKMQDGLPSNDVAAIKKDNMGRLWVSTGSGLAIVSDSIVSSLNFIYGVNKEYNKSAILKLTDGRMIFGSTAGAVLIAPHEVSIIDFPASIRITDYSIEGIDEEENIINRPDFKRMIEEGKIILRPNYNSFDIEFEAINIPFRDDIHYSYYLKGYDHDWSDISPYGTARYRNVPPGKYDFEIKAVRKSDGKTIDTYNLEIIIKAPWWKTIWAKIAYVLLFITIIFYVMRYKWYQLRKEHDEDKIRFFINTAHDIRTPLSLVMAPLEDLRNEKNLSENAKYLLDVAGSNIRKLNAITSQLLDFEKIDSKKVSIRFEPINLNFLLSEEVSCFRNICEQKGINLILTVPEEDIIISADRHMLEIMLDNLLSNACKYTNSGGKVEILLESNRTKAIINIFDNGIGIPLKEQKNIFTNVYRAENARATQEAGNGFGLLQVRKIVDMLHGNIRFSSKEGEGTSFIINFKRIYEEPAVQWNPSKINESIAEISTSAYAATQQTQDKENTLLIVEDNDDLRNYLTSTFSTEYNVVAASSAEDALIFLSSHYPDIILSDVMMTGMQGDELCRTIKENKETSGIPVILLTAKNTHDAIMAGLDKGADDYIAKPFSLDILKSKIRGILSNRKRIREYLLRHAVKKAESIPSEISDIPAASDLPPGATPEVENEGVGIVSAALSEADRLFVDKATAIVVDNISDSEFSIDMLCREMAMSRTLLFGRLKSLTGKGPQEFIRILRLERAAELLRRGLSVNNVSDQTGFVNTKYFSTVFKKHFGVSPSKFN